MLNAIALERRDLIEVVARQERPLAMRGERGLRLDGEIRGARPSSG